MKKPLFTGVCTALVTPFINGEINYPMLSVLLQRQIDAEIPAVVICGTTGEAPTLSDREKIRLFRYCKDFVGERMKIIAGTGSNSTSHAVELSMAAQEEGVDGLLVVSPYYNKASEDGLLAHYLSIAHSVKIPVIVYNVPSRTGQDIPVSVYKQLSRVSNIAGVKEASQSISKVLEIKATCGNAFSIWAGNDDMTVPVISLGGQGVISVASNVYPERMQTMAAAAIDGDFDTAAAIQCHLAPLLKLLFMEVNPIPVKAAMKELGLDCGPCRLPLTSLKKENQTKITEFFK